MKLGLIASSLCLLFLPIAEDDWLVETDTYFAWGEVSDLGHEDCAPNDVPTGISIHWLCEFVSVAKSTIWLA